MCEVAENRLLDLRAVVDAALKAIRKSEPSLATARLAIAADEAANRIMQALERVGGNSLH